jgi:hypothetical protein
MARWFKISLVISFGCEIRDRRLAIARRDEHVPGFRQVRFVAERSMPRNNLGVIVGERENFVGSGDSKPICSLVASPSAICGA